MADETNAITGNLSPDADLTSASKALSAVLKQLGDVVARMNADQYVAKGVSHVEGAAGGHVRHCLDHVMALLGGLSTGCIDYETRERGTCIESDGDEAVAALNKAADRIERLDVDDMAQPVRVIVRFTADLGTVATGSTIGREMAFVLSHTIHHDALIAAIAKAQGVELPEYFGYAPSSEAFLKQQ